MRPRLLAVSGSAGAVPLRLGWALPLWARQREDAWCQGDCLGCQDPASWELLGP